MVDTSWGEACADTLGTFPITDRHRLYEYLKRIDGANYKSLFIDIRFEQLFATDIDSALFAQIGRMPRVVVATHFDEQYRQIDNEDLKRVSAIADYHNWLNMPFTRYELIQRGVDSAPIVIYNHLTGNHVKRHSIFGIKWLGFYTDEGRLCYNSMFVPFSFSAQNILAKKEDFWNVNNGAVSDYEEIDDDYVDDYESVDAYGAISRKYKYGLDYLLDNQSADNLKSQIDGKVVIIGDYDSGVDSHSTYIGDMPGPIINYYAYRALVDGRHLVNYWVYLLLFVIYTAIIYRILAKPRKQNLQTKPNQSKLKAFFRGSCVFALSLCGWGFVLFVAKCVLYCTLGFLLNVSIPSVLFSGFKTYSNFQK